MQNNSIIPCLSIDSLIDLVGSLKQICSLQGQKYCVI